MDLARVVSVARSRLGYGQWAQVLKFLPFSKRKANMLAAIGKRFAWLEGQTFARLPSGWSILYQLAQLDRVTFERFVQEGVVHPGLSLREARALLASFKGQSNKPKSRRNNLKQRLQQFGDFVGDTVLDWSPEERALAEKELTRLLELIGRGDRDEFEQGTGVVRAGHTSSQPIFTNRRKAAVRSPQQPQTTV
jgi:hypothetical protein